MCDMNINNGANDMYGMGQQVGQVGPAFFKIKSIFVFRVNLLRELLH
jgi:hypothetical protein